MDFYYVPINYDTTLEELVSDPLSEFGSYKNNIPLLINGFKNDGKSNFDRIIENYSTDDLTSEAIKITTKQLTLIRANTSLMLPKGELSMNLLALTGKNLFIRDIKSFNTFYGTYLNLLQLDGFTPAFKTTTNDNQVDIRNYSISVWVWSRVYSQNGTLLLDITKYVEHCSINVNGTQNSFSLSLQAINDKPNSGLNTPFDVGDESINRVNIDTALNTGNLSTLEHPNTVEQLPLPWFKRILQQNDIFFIRFEQLTLEKTEDRVKSSMEVPASQLPGKIFDMIGLVDRVSHQFNPMTTDMTVEVLGRDLTKLLIEDGSYFFPLLFTENSDMLFFNTQADDKWFKRTFIKNTFDYLFLYKMQSVRDSLGFVVNQLTNLGACNDTLFQSYDDKGDGGLEGAGLGGRRSRTLQLTGQNKNQLVWNVVSGIWQIVDLLVDQQIEDRRIANSQISNPNGNLQSVIDSFCQRPFVEFFGDTYGDKFTFIARTPPYTKNAILSVLNGGYYIDVNLRDVEDIDLEWDSTFYTWFEMDPRNMFLGASSSIALAYLPVVWFPEIAEAFGNKQFKITDNYISNQAFTGVEGSENRDLFKQKVVEDFLYAIESYCYLPFTETGTITLKRDRRIKARTWIKVGSQFFYVDSVSNSFTAVGEKIDGNTSLNVSRGMYIDYIRGKMVKGNNLDRIIDYWSMVKLDVLRETLIQKMQVTAANTINTASALAIAAVNPAGGSPIMASVSKNTVKVSFGTDKDAFDFFLQRKFLP
jgi:hypothetical protein